jgi:hypothetical protein
MLREISGSRRGSIRSRVPKDFVQTLHGHGAAADTDPAHSLPWLEPLCRHWDAMSNVSARHVMPPA